MFSGPVVIQPERNTRMTAAVSASLMAGLEKGRKALFCVMASFAAASAAGSGVTDVLVSGAGTRDNPAR
jgi:hypothetical protein